MIAYPLDFPNTKAPAAITWRAVQVDAASVSPLTLVARFYKYQGQRFEADITMPPMARADAETFIAFFLKLGGRSGTFLLGPTEARQPRGTIAGHLIFVAPTGRFDYGDLASFVDSENYGSVTATATETDDYGSVAVALLPLNPDGQEVTNDPTTDGVTVRGNTIRVQGLPESEDGVLLAGDFIQIGAAATAKLYKILDPVNSDATGRAELLVWPDVIAPISANAPVIVTNTRGVFRLERPIVDWSIDNMKMFGIVFGVVEVK